jgi:hypothetical protein
MHRSFRRMPPLPETAQQIADIIGREPTLALAAKCKHRKLYVPHALNEDHWIVKTIGLPLARKLQFECRGLYLDLAKCTSIAVAERNNKIRAAYKESGDRTSIIREHGISLRAFRYIVKGIDGRPKPKRQRLS